MLCAQVSRKFRTMLAIFAMLVVALAALARAISHAMGYSCFANWNGAAGACLYAFNGPPICRAYLRIYPQWRTPFGIRSPSAAFDTSITR